MPGLLINKPISFVAAAAGWTGVANLDTKSPREICVAPGVGAQSIEVDLLVDQDIDCFFLGATNARADAVWTIQTIAGPGGAVTATHVNAQTMRLAGNIRSRYHCLVRLAAPVAGRYFRITINQPTTVFEIGRLVVSLAFDWPYALGGGRAPVDTSRVVALPDGGFGVDEGVVKAMFQWRFLDLSPAALAKLWQIVEELGESRTLVVVEGPDYPPLATSVHYGLFRRLEAFEREDPAQTKWAMTVEEWR